MIIVVLQILQPVVEYRRIIYLSHTKNITTDSTLLKSIDGSIVMANNGASTSGLSKITHSFLHEEHEYSLKDD